MKNSKSLFGGKVEIIGPDAASINAVAEHIVQVVTAGKSGACPNCGEVHTVGALDAANVILNGKIKIETAFGTKTVCGVADLIDRESLPLTKERERLCFRACAGLTDEQLSKMVIGQLGGEHTRHEAMLAALNKLAGEHQELLQTHYGHYPMNCIDYAFEALAKTGGAS